VTEVIPRDEAVEVAAGSSSRSDRVFYSTDFEALSGMNRRAVAAEEANRQECLGHSTSHW
jgi:hypothetical protein